MKDAEVSAAINGVSSPQMFIHSHIIILLNVDKLNLTPFPCTPTPTQLHKTSYHVPMLIFPCFSAIPPMWLNLE